MSRDERIGETVLGKYRIVSTIGAGGMGAVYEAEDLRLGRPVAIKVLKTPANAHAYGDMGRRFRREARTIAQVTHPNLVTLLEFDLLEDGTPAMVMERVEGLSLRELLRTRPFSALEVAEIMRQSLSALAVCHQAQIVHRDLKPGNILLVEQGGELRVKIIDFGLTKLITPDSSVLTQAGEIFGSPRFMAPEQWMGKEVDGRTDLYALGIIGYCLLLGRHFIAQGNPVDVCRAHIQQPRPALERDLHGNPIPPELAAALLKATMPKINQRFADATAMRVAITGQSPILRSSQSMPSLTAAGPAAVPQAVAVAEPVDSAYPTALSVGPTASGPVDENATVVDTGLAAIVRQASRGQYDEGESSVNIPVSPNSMVLRATSRSVQPEDGGSDTETVPRAVRNALQVMDRADVEAALRATAENQRPSKPARARPVSAPANAAEPGEPASAEPLELPSWAYVVAGLVAAGAAALVVLLLK